MANELVTFEEVRKTGLEILDRIIAEHSLNETQEREIRTAVSAYLGWLTGKPYHPK